MCQHILLYLPFIFCDASCMLIVNIVVTGRLFCIKCGFSRHSKIYNTDIPQSQEKCSSQTVDQTILSIINEPNLLNLHSCRELMYSCGAVMSSSCLFSSSSEDFLHTIVNNRLKNELHYQISWRKKLVISTTCCHWDGGFRRCTCLGILVAVMLLIISFQVCWINKEV
jgi:hypothetical protein